MQCVFLRMLTNEYPKRASTGIFSKVEVCNP